MSPREPRRKGPASAYRRLLANVFRFGLGSLGSRVPRLSADPVLHQHPLPDGIRRDGPADPDGELPAAPGLAGHRQRRAALRRGGEDAGGRRLHRGPAGRRGGQRRAGAVQPAPAAHRLCGGVRGAFAALRPLRQSPRPVRRHGPGARARAALRGDGRSLHGPGRGAEHSAAVRAAHGRGRLHPLQRHCGRGVGGGALLRPAALAVHPSEGAAPQPAARDAPLLPAADPRDGLHLDHQHLRPLLPH